MAAVVAVIPVVRIVIVAEQKNPPIRMISPAVIIARKISIDTSLSIVVLSSVAVLERAHGTTEQRRYRAATVRSESWPARVVEDRSFTAAAQLMLE